jgi:hypothetical protein
MIDVGNVVEICVNTKADAFLGIVLDTSSSKNFMWYKVQPLSKKDMPGIFWYKENKIEKIADTPSFLSIDGGQSGE